jgi:hypothetical protein
MPALQPPEHLVPSAHWFDAHADAGPVWHAPPLQVPAVVSTPLAQLLAAQALTQAPQFAESEARFLQTPLQLV